MRAFFRKAHIHVAVFHFKHAALQGALHWGFHSHKGYFSRKGFAVELPLEVKLKSAIICALAALFELDPLAVGRAGAVAVFGAHAQVLAGNILPFAAAGGKSKDHHKRQQRRSNSFHHVMFLLELSAYFSG